MTVGVAVVVAPTSVANGASTDIRPASDGIEWVIHNIYIPDGKVARIYRGNGTNWIDLGTVTGSMYAFAFHVTYAQYLRIANESGNTMYVGYDGIQSR